MKKPRLSTLKSLFARSLNRCAYPGCPCPIAEPCGTVTGEVCHIKADSPGGPRYDRQQTSEDRHSESNLLLLCGRHHTMIDADPEKFPVDVLMQMKRNHQASGTPVITPDVDRIAQALLQRYEFRISIRSNNGVIAIASPNAQIHQTIHIKTAAKKPTIKIEPPTGSIGDSQPMKRYITYLIGRYQDFQKAHKDKAGRGKYIVIHNALRRDFKGKWELLSTDRFTELASYLQRRIDNTLIGRLNTSRGIKNYASIEEHLATN